MTIPTRNWSWSDRAKVSLILPIALLSIGLAVIARPATHLALTAVRDLDDRLPLPQGNVDDASHLNATPMKVVVLESNWTQAVGQLRSLLKQAKAQGTTLTPAGSRHTMGGQTLQAQGIALDMTPFKQMQLDRDRRTLTVQSGATWADVIPFLNDQGFSVAVMQSNNDFSIGGTLSANAHGWQHNYSPFASTVESLRLMLADGRIIQCSRQVNQELFSLVLGGYGLFGIVLDVDLAVVPNELYRAEQEIMSSADYAERYRQRVPGFSSTGQSGLGPKPGSALGHAVDDTSSREASLAETPAPELNRDPASVGLAYGRLSITPDHFLQEAILTTYHRLPLESPAANLPSSSPSHSPATPTTHSPTTSPIHPEPYSLDETYPLGLARVVFRGSIGSDYGKNLRWQLEKLQGEAVGDLQSRNQILNRSSSFFENRRQANTEILHEYFIPPDNLQAFLEQCRRIMPSHDIELLNITLRYVNPDPDSFLRYSNREMIGLVMLFHQQRNATDEVKMQALTQELVEAAIALQGRYYLPYRLHASLDQFHRAYPQAKAFFRLKRQYDPDEIFQNRFYATYGHR